jgi:uncharacterized protein (UPF0212 family)
MESKLAALGEEFNNIKEKIKDYEDRLTEIKNEISKILTDNDTGYMEVPLGDCILKFKNNTKITKSFDKIGLATKVELDKDDLDYVGLSKAVENCLVCSTDVEEFQTTNTSNFITVRMTKAKRKKVK